MRLPVVGGPPSPPRPLPPPAKPASRPVARTAGGQKPSFKGTVKRFAPWLRRPYRALEGALHFVRYLDPRVAMDVLRGRERTIDFEALTARAQAVRPTMPAEYLRFVETGVVPPLATVAVELTNVCNLRCTFCDREGLDRIQGYMDDALFEKCIDEIAEMGACANLNRFGESTLDKKLVERVRYAKQRGVHHVYFTSNAMKLTEGMARDLILAGLDRITISYDGAVKETAERLRIGTKFETLNRNIENLLRLKKELGAVDFTVNLRVTLVKENLGELLDIYRRFYGRVSNIIFTLAYNYENIDAGNRVGWDERISCPLFVSRSVVCTDGSQIMCCLGDVNGTLKAGDARTRSIRETYEGEGAGKFREAHRRGDWAATPVCESCTASHMTFWYDQAANEMIRKRAMRIIHTERLLGRGWLPPIL